MKKPINYKCGEKIKSHSFVSKFHNEHGKIDKKKLGTTATLMFIAINTTIVFLIYLNNYFKEDLVTTIDEFIKSTIAIIKEFLFYHMIPPKEFIDALIISLIVSIPFIIYFRYKIKKAAKFQAILSSAGLQQYRLIKQKNKKYYLVFNEGTKNAFNTFLLQKENLSQMLGYEHLKFKRWRYNGVIIQGSDRFPTIEDLKGLKIESFIKPDKIFLGIGLPNIDEQYNKKDLIKSKYLPRYINFSDLPVGTANLGSSGSGKSNSMNQYLYSIFYNFKQISSFYFIDFKGGIEAAPIQELEKQYKTNKIHIFDDNKQNLFKTLKKLYLINKARMKFLKQKGLKKMDTNFIVLLFDELAEILDVTVSTKEDRYIQEKIVFYIESLLRTGRSQGFKILYSTQSFLSTASGLTSGMKNNTQLRIMHTLSSKMQVSSVKAVDELNLLSIDPTNYTTGKNVVINGSDNTIYEVQSLYVEEDFINHIKIDTTNDSEFEEKIKLYYKEVLDEWKNDLITSNQKDDEIYPLEALAKDLNIELKKVDTPTNESKNDIQNTKAKKETTPLSKTPPKKNIASKINKNKQKINNNPEDVQKFLNSVSNSYNDDET